MDNDFEIVDFRRGLTQAQREKIVPVDTVSSEIIDSARKISGVACQTPSKDSQTMPDTCAVYEHKEFDGPSQNTHYIFEVSDSSDRAQNFSVSVAT